LLKPKKKEGIKGSQARIDFAKDTTKNMMVKAIF